MGAGVVGMSECAGADLSELLRVLGEGLERHADIDGLTGVRRAVFMARGGHAPGHGPCLYEAQFPAVGDGHEYWCPWPDDECGCSAGRPQ